jgi:hypothetical protein
MKATKLAIAATLVLGSISFAAAQGSSGSSGTGSAEGRNTPGQSDARPAPAEQKTPENTRTGGESGGAMQQKNTGMSSGQKQDENAGPKSPSAGSTK